jgi:hypothetical protein
MFIARDDRRFASQVDRDDGHRPRRGQLEVTNDFVGRRGLSDRRLTSAPTGRAPDDDDPPGAPTNLIVRDVRVAASAGSSLKP